MGRRKGVPYKPVLRRKLVGATLAVAHAGPRRPRFDRHGTPQGRPLQAGSAAQARRGDPCGRPCWSPTASVRSPWDAARASPTSRRRKLRPLRSPMLVPDGLGSIGVGRRKGVPYKPVLRRKLVGATLAVAHAGGPRRPRFDRHGTPQGRPLQAGSAAQARRGDPCGRPCWSRRPRFDRHGTPQGRPLQAGSAAQARRGDPCGRPCWSPTASVRSAWDAARASPTSRFCGASS